MFHSNKDKILPQIQLKYHYFVNEKGERSTYADLECGQCGQCGKVGIIVAGGTHFDGQYKPVCEECALMWTRGQGIVPGVDPQRVCSYLEAERGLRDGGRCGPEALGHGPMSPANPGAPEAPEDPEAP